ncbi:hypothetical protein [Kocuria rosea]|uniref:hypothetical protein n=1 Tax=Kocuria rosea TaxID=1275 RepID=UPI0011A52C58|nr:hypothetical protein [Kocuria rosea]
MAIWDAMARFRNLSSGWVRVSVPTGWSTAGADKHPELAITFSERVGLLVAQIPSQAMTLFWSSAVLTLVCYLVAALTGVVLCYRLARRVAFTPTMRWAATGAGILAFVSGVAVTVLEGYATYLTMHSLPEDLTAASSTGLGSIGIYIVDNIDLLFFVVGLNLLLLAAVLSRGTRYYQDVKELV